MPELPIILTMFVYSNQEYYYQFMEYFVDKMHMIKYTVKKFDITKEATHAYIMKLILEYLETLKPKKNNEEKKETYVAQTLFKDGTLLIKEEFLC